MRCYRTHSQNGYFRRAGSAGFTLIELMVAVSIAAMLLGVVIPYVGERTEINLSSTARLVSGVVRFASGEAILRRRPTRLYVDFTKNRYWVSGWTEDGFAPLANPLGKARKPLDGVFFQEIFVDGESYQKGIVFVEFDTEGGVENSILTLGNETGDLASVVPDGDTGIPEIVQGGADPKKLFNPEPAHGRLRGPKGR